MAGTEDLTHLHLDTVTDLENEISERVEKFRADLALKQAGGSVPKGQIASNFRFIWNALDLRDQIVNNASKRVE